MKKLCAAVLILLAVTSMVFADDASVMPAKVGRVFVIPIYAFINGSYEDGKYEKNPGGAGDVKAFLLAFAVEYGVTDWISAAVQWTPAWTVWSNINKAAKTSGAPGDGDMNGPSDIFVGAKFQIIGPKAPVKSDQFRFSAATGVKIPLPGYNDWSGAVADMRGGKDFHARDPDKHAWAFGGRLYFDWVINEYFYLDFYNETMFFPIEAHQKSLISSTAKQDILYGPDLTFEIEPHFDYTLSDAIKVGAGLPITWVYRGQNKVDGTKDSKTDSSIFYLRPLVSVFFTKLPLPVQVEGGYDIPVYGREGIPTHKLSLKIKTYFRIP